MDESQQAQREEVGRGKRRELTHERSNRASRKDVMRRYAKYWNNYTVELYKCFAGHLWDNTAVIWVGRVLIKWAGEGFVPG